MKTYKVYSKHLKTGYTNLLFTYDNPQAAEKRLRWLEECKNLSDNIHLLSYHIETE